MAVVYPEWSFYLLIIVAVSSILMNLTQHYSVKNNHIASMAMKALKGNRRMCFTHFPSGILEISIPVPEKGMENNAPIWNVGGSRRFKDITGEKWETCGPLKVLHYTARHPTPVGTNQAVAVSQLNDILGDAGFATKGHKKEIFYMISESAKGEAAEQEAWKRLGNLSMDTKDKIKEILEFLKSNPDIKFQLFKEGGFTYQTAVSVVDQICADTVVETSNLISFIEDKERRKRQDRMNELMKYVVIFGPLMVIAAIAAVIVLVGGGLVGK